MKRTLAAALFFAFLAGGFHRAAALGADEVDTLLSERLRKPAERKEPEAKRDRTDRLKRAHAVSRINRRVVNLFKAGKYDQCKTEIRKILEIDPDNSTAWYNLACADARLNRPARAVKNLQVAIEKGYSNFRHMERDPDLEALRKTPGYKGLLERKDEIQRARAESTRLALVEQFGEGYIYEIDHDRKLIFATNVDRTTLEELRARLTDQAEALWNDLFTYGFEQYVTVVIPKPEAMRSPSMGGYYSHARRMLVARNIGMTLAHEFTHALHGADQDGLGQRHPIWITEGLATLAETSEITDGHLIPTPNRRLHRLKTYVQRKQAIPWKQLLAYSHAGFMKKTTLSYPQSRYIMMYLHEKGLLKKWYDAYTEGYDNDRTGAKAMEKVFGKKLSEVEADWSKWVKAQKAPPLRIGPNQAYMGVSLRSAPDGLRIARVVPGSGAEKAGLRAGDIIISVDNRRTVDSGDLIGLISSLKVGDRVRVRFRRADEHKTVSVMLKAMPRNLVPGRRPRGADKRKQPKKIEPKKNAPASRPAKKAA